MICDGDELETKWKEGFIVYWNVNICLYGQRKAMIGPGNVSSFWAKTENQHFLNRQGGANCWTVTFRICTTCPIYLILDSATLIIGEVQKFKAFSVKVHAHVTCSSLGPHILHNTLYCTVLLK
jgi:hypothetical protein